VATAFFGGTYEETLKLVRRARDYLAFSDPIRAEVRPLPRMIVARESCRMTARLTRVMAWMMAIRAAHQGELEMAEALGEDFDLGLDRVCLAQPSDLAVLPLGFRKIVDDCDRLYRRVARLGEMARRDRAAAERLN
jgi:regulator of CtrA degradation